MKSRKTILLISLVMVLVLGFGVLWLGFGKQHRTQAAPDIHTSPIHGGCYIAGPSDCRLHVEPFTITVASGKKLVYFQLLANPSTGNSQVIYDFRPDLSNPLPSSGTTVTPSLVAQDFAATCGVTYSISLQGRDTGDSSTYNLGATGQFTCPTNVP